MTNLISIFVALCFENCAEIFKPKSTEEGRGAEEPGIFFLALFCYCKSSLGRRRREVKKREEERNDSSALLLRLFSSHFALQHQTGKPADTCFNIHIRPFLSVSVPWLTENQPGKQRSSSLLTQPQFQR